MKAGLGGYTVEELVELFKENPKQTALLLKVAKEKRKRREKKTRFDLENFCSLPGGKIFQKQYDFITDEARFKTFDKSRRAGGTMSLAGLFLDVGTTKPNVNMAYVTLDRGTAERIIWPELVRLSDAWGVEAKFNQQKLWIEFPNGSLLYMAGAKDRNEINKLRGKAFYLVALDECQSFRDSLMKELIDDVLEASLIDYGGRLILVGTPNAACRGYFYDSCKSDGWKHFHWTMKDNPWLEHKSGLPVETIQKQHLERKGITEDDPTFQREWLGKWVRDEHAIVYKYKEERNEYWDLPDGQAWRTVLGADIGFHDADAISIWAFSEDLPYIYLVYAEQNAGQDVSSFAERVKALESKHGPFIKRVLDTGGLGKKICEELRRRHNIYFDAAEKTRKHEYIKLMNDDFQKGWIKAKNNSPVVEEWKVLQWDVSKDPPIEDERFPNDLSDSALYGWREAKHYTFQEEVKPARQGTNRWANEEWQRISEADQKRQKEQWWEGL